MEINFAGFARFLEYSGEPAYGHGKDGTMDSIDVQSMELGVPEKAFEKNVPWAGSNIQIGSKIMAGNSSVEVVRITDNTVTLRVNDDGNKRFVKKPGGLYNDPQPSVPKEITVPRAYFIKMCDNQWSGMSGAMAGPAGGGPPMM